MNKKQQIAKSIFQYLTIPVSLLVIGATLLTYMSLLLANQYVNFFLSDNSEFFWWGYFVVLGIIIGAITFIAGFVLFSKFYFVVKQMYPKTKKTQSKI